MNLGLRHLLVRQIGDRAAPVGHSVELAVMKSNENAVRRGVHIGLQIAVSECRSLCECMQAVLTVQVRWIRGPTTMGECDERRLEERICVGAHGLIMGRAQFSWGRTPARWQAPG